MRRILLWLMGTLTVVVLLFGYHTSLEGSAVTATPPAAISGSSSAGSDSSSGSGTTDDSGSTGSGTTDDSGSSGSGTDSGDGSSSDSTSGSSSSDTTTSTVTGDVAETQWGPVQVELTIKSGKVTAVDVPEYPNNNGRDYEINSYALPVLIQETIDAQSAQIDMVSGATVTSEGYLQSLQSALDKASL